MREHRCPWCGHKVNLREDSKDTKYRFCEWQGKAYMRARCRSCGGYYGRTPHCTLGVVASLCSILCLVVGILLLNWPIMFSSLLFIFLTCLTPLQKLDEYGQKISPDYSFDFDVEIQQTYIDIKYGEMYFLIRGFDNAENYKGPAPFVMKKSKKHRVRGAFLYDCEENEAYLEGESRIIYDGNNNVIAKIKIVA